MMKLWGKAKTLQNVFPLLVKNILWSAQGRTYKYTHTLLKLARYPEQPEESRLSTHLRTSALNGDNKDNLQMSASFFFPQQGSSTTCPSIIILHFPTIHGVLCLVTRERFLCLWLIRHKRMTFYFSLIAAQNHADSWRGECFMVTPWVPQPLCKWDLLIWTECKETTPLPLSQ